MDWVIELVFVASTNCCPLFLYDRYAFEGTLLAIYSYERDPLECEGKEGDKPCVYTSGESVLKGLDVEDGKFYVDFLMLCTFFVLLRLACYLVLRWRIRRS